MINIQFSRLYRYNLQVKAQGRLILLISQDNFIIINFRIEINLGWRRVVSIAHIIQCNLFITGKTTQRTVQIGLNGQAVFAY